MRFHVFFTSLLITLTLLLASIIAPAQIISPSAKEVKYSYRTTFEVPKDSFETTNLERAQFHASHLFGLLASKTNVEKFGLSEITEGLGAPRIESTFRINKVKYHTDTIEIDYSNSGKMILHKKAAEQVLLLGSMVLPMPKNPYDVYDPKCTDKHYDTFGDFWYFYDAYQAGCEHLLSPEMAIKTSIKFSEHQYKKTEVKMPLKKIRGDNGNGPLFSISIITGYEEKPGNSDYGQKNFKELKQILTKQMGFDVVSKYVNTTIPMNIYTKELELASGKKIQIEIKNLLADTDITTKTVSFAKFFKEAIENSDIIIYGGHSGLGANLDISLLQEKAGTYKFNAAKKQIFFFDSCSSYSYYLDPFSYQKTKAKIDIISYGLPSFFETGNLVLESFLTQLISKDETDPKWEDVLQKLEDPLQGETYLLNVGSI